MRNDKLTAAEIAQWIDNDEGLYDWRRREFGGHLAVLEPQEAFDIWLEVAGHRHHFSSGGKRKGSPYPRLF